MTFLPFSHFEHGVIDDALKHQRSGVGTEILFCLDASGTTLIDQAVGQPNRVQLTPTMTAHLVSGHHCRLIHNHPSNGSLSAADWRLCLNFPNIDEIVAVNDRGSSFRGAVRDAALLDKAVQVPSSRFDAALVPVTMVTCSSHLDPGEPLAFPSALDWSPSHVLNERLHLVGAIAYEARLQGIDAALAGDPFCRARLNRGLAEAAKHLP